MGGQSQRRDGSIKKCKKAATKRNQRTKARKPAPKPTPESDRRLFIPEIDCRICCARSRLKNGQTTRSPPHRSHHPQCPNNNKNRNSEKGQDRGLKARMTAFLKMADLPAPPALLLPPAAVVPATDAALLAKSAIPKSSVLPRMHLRSGSSPSNYFPREGTKNVAKQLRNHVSKVMSDLQNYKEEPSNNWIDACQAPTAVVVAIQYLLGLFEHRRPKSAEGLLPTTAGFKDHYGYYKKLFPTGECDFTFPIDPDMNVCPPDPFYHSIESKSLFYLDWQMMYPGLKILCHECDVNGEKNYLVHTRTNFGKNKVLYPLW